MANTNSIRLPGTSLTQPVIDLLTGNIAEKGIINSQLNAALKSQLTASATAAQQTPLANLLQNLAPGDLATDQNLSLRDFVTKYTALSPDAAVKQPVQAAIATLSATTTVGALLGLSGAVSDNPVFSGIVARTRLTTLLSTSPALTAQLQTDFIAKYISFQGKARDFWTQLSEDAEFKSVVPELQFTMQLGLLTLNNSKLVGALRENFKPASLRDLTTLDASALAAFLTAQKIEVPAGISGPTPAEQLANYAEGMIDLLEAAFPTSYVAKGLAASSDPALRAVAGVLSNAADIDLRLTNIESYLKQNSATALQNVPPDQVAAVTDGLKSAQRIARIAKPAQVPVLLKAGLDSASKITASSRDAFVSRFSSILGGDSSAQAVYASASHINAQALNVYRTIQSGIREVSPRAIGTRVLDLIETVQQQIPSWGDLFGLTSYCECSACSSVYGAAAYFVDLLEFLRKSNANASGLTPLDVLVGGSHTEPSEDAITVIGRRPDLPFIKLDCQNANTPLPYIDLINEILESYIALEGRLDRTTAQNTRADATEKELVLSPEFTIDAAYTALSTATYPLSLPYDRYLDVARRYLDFLGDDRQQVIHLFQTHQAPVDTACLLAAESLGLSYAEVKLITGWDFQLGSAATSLELETLYGFPAATPLWETLISSVPTFLKQTGLEFADLIDLLETQFVNTGQTMTLQGSEACDLTKTTITSLDDSALRRILPFVRLWKRLGWSMSDLDKVLRVIAPNGINRDCLLALADVVYLQARLNLSFPRLVSLWANIDIDGRDSLYIELFQKTAKYVTLIPTVPPPVPPTMTAILNPVEPAFQLSYRSGLPTKPSADLPASVTGQASYDSGALQLVFTGVMTDDQRSDLLQWADGNAAATLAVENLYEMRWEQGTDIIPGGTITGNIAGILAALRISSDDLNAIRVATGLIDTATPTPLNLANLSNLYRCAIFAQALGFSIPDFISLISLTGISPFQVASTGSAVAPTVQFLQAAQAVIASRFSVAQLNYIYRAIANPAAGIGPLDTDVDQLVIELRKGLEKIAAANAYTPDPNGKILRQKLGVVLESTQLTAAMGLIDGSVVYNSGLAALPAGTLFPTSLDNIISYDSANQLLTFKGAMSEADAGALRVFLPADVDYQKAVSDLYQQPRTVLATDLSFLNTTDALTKLIDAPSPNLVDTYSWVLQSLLSHLAQTESRNLVQQSLGQALGLDSPTTALLLSGALDPTLPALLHSQKDVSQPSILDLLDLRDGGVLATYFSDIELTTVTATGIDATVNIVDNGMIVPNPGGVRWNGKVLAEFSESYTFYVTANDGVRLWVDDQLLIDQWVDQTVSPRISAPINLTAGQLYKIRLDYFNTSTAPMVQLGWSGKSTTNDANALIPQSSLFPENAFLTLSRLYPVGILLSAFAMKPSEVAWLSSHGADFAGVDPGDSANAVVFDLSSLPVDRSNSTGVDRKAVAFFNQWMHLNDLFALRRLLPSGNVTLFDIFRAASSSIHPTELGSATTSAVLAATGWDATDFATLSGKTMAGSSVIGFNLSDADFVNAKGRNGAGLVQLKKCLDLGSRLGVSAAQLFSWANNPPSSSQANDIKSTVKAKYDDASWITVGQPLSNQIRDDSKAALIAYVLNLPTIVSLGITNADGLYEYFLIDVQMTSCMQTSRIVQAAAAIQLFVQRCLLNLEFKVELNPDGTTKQNPDGTPTTTADSVSAEAISAAQWDWRKNYRVWEANREVFLYPENWIDPTLRDNRTPFFQDLQTELQQGEITGERAEQAFQNYLTKLLEVSRLEICGFYHEVDSDADATHNVYHVFARTFANPHIYYYRRLDNITQIWSAWERVDADIQGDHLIPVIWNRRLYLFWPIFKETSTPATAAPNGVLIPSTSVGTGSPTGGGSSGGGVGGGASGGGSGGPIDGSRNTGNERPLIATLGASGNTSVMPQLPLKSLEVQFAWSEYRNGAWSKKQVTVDPLTPGLFSGYTGDFNPGTLSFRASPQGPALALKVYCWAPFGPDTTPFPDRPSLASYNLFDVGQIVFGGCSTVPAILPNGTPIPEDQNMQGVPIPYNTLFEYMSLEENLGIHPPQDPSALNKLTLTSLIPAGMIGTLGGLLLPKYTRNPFPVLQSTPNGPPSFKLIYPQQFLPNVQANVASPFFYADGSRTYLAIQELPTLTGIFSNPAYSIVPYSPVELNPPLSSLQLSTHLPIFEARTADEGAVVDKAPPLVDAVMSASMAAPPTTVATRPAITGTPPGVTPGTPTPAALATSPTSGTVMPVTDPANGIAASPLMAWENLILGPHASHLTFSIHFHPHACDFLKALNWQGIPGLLNLLNQSLDSSDIGTASKFYTTYNPADSVTQPYPSEDVDFSPEGAYSLYNWEIFFHIPFLIATQLSQNQQFNDAEKWFRYIFNPSNSTGDIPRRYWNVLPLQPTENDTIQNLIAALASDGTDSESFREQITAWQINPFDPDVVARMRLVAYKKAVLMRYIDHHLLWGDSLYRQFTRETVNEATLHYVLCQDLLGEKPVLIPTQGFVEDQTYYQLTTTSTGLDAFSDTMVQMENLFPFGTANPNSTSGDSGATSAASVVTVPYFCMPPNDKLLGYWDTVAQRLFQLRHCLNIAGQEQALPLFAPPIDPGQLIHALAMGMDLTSALNDINAALPFYRFAYMLPKALELCAEVRSLAASLLSALEKSDAEALSMLRTTQESALLKAVRNVKQQQLNEANFNVAALNDSLAVAANRQQHYAGLLAVGQSAYEQSQLHSLAEAQAAQQHSYDAQLASILLSLEPTVNVGLNGFGGSPSLTASVGGPNLALAANASASWFARDAAKRSSNASLSGLVAGFDRRTEDWLFQQQSATLEIQQINDQIKAAAARVNAAQAELDNQDLQISNSSDIEQFLRTKYSNQALYDWMVGQVSSVYFQCYQMAYDLAKRAEACFVFERMPDLSSYSFFIQFGYWDSLKKGLLSGERLYQDLKRLEIAYMDQNQRDYEITKSISLLLLDAMALINLKETGQCTVQFPEALFDMDYPGHYLRRLKSIGITIPCVVGPYTSVNCTLTLATNKIRFNNMAADAKDYIKDSRYLTNFAAAESIATSSAQNDSGLFMVNFNDERYLPFEGAGVISTWQLSMPEGTNAFDFETITDVIFNLKYTARDGGSALREIAKAAAVLPPPSLRGATSVAQTVMATQTNLTRLFSLRHEFPNDWQKFLHPPDSAPDQTMSLDLTQERFPFQYRGKKIQIYEVDIFLKFRDLYDPVKYAADGTPQGDYTAKGESGALAVTLTPQSGTAKTVQLVSNTAILAGVPYGTIPEPPPTAPPVPPPLGSLGGWTLTAKGTDVGNIAASLQVQVSNSITTYSRLASDVIEDMFLICRYSLG